MDGEETPFAPVFQTMFHIIVLCFLKIVKKKMFTDNNLLLKYEQKYCFLIAYYSAGIFRMNDVLYENRNRENKKKTISNDSFFKIILFNELTYL